MTTEQTTLELEEYAPCLSFAEAARDAGAGLWASTVRADVSELEIGDRIAGPHSWTPVVTITAVGEMLWADPFGRVSRDVWGVVEATGDPIRLQLKPGVPIPLIREEL